MRMTETSFALITAVNRKAKMMKMKTKTTKKMKKQIIGKRMKKMEMESRMRTRSQIEVQMMASSTKGTTTRMIKAGFLMGEKTNACRIPLRPRLIS